ncbi:sel1 repeat family protein [Neisseria sicca]|uniref:sel1 repeat family protein n=1 Tax=Neisseria sicca TaxID=490 RepID=UPI0015F4248D|nr:sel1 repeat family protein [Neisseria sicca]QMT37607.1 sel1 repeat family protein [Neisseria sicca]
MMDVNDFFIECNKLFDDGKYTEVIRRLDQFLAGIIDKNIQIREQILAQLLLGCCYLELAKKTKDTDEAEKLLKDADEHYQNMLRLTDQLTDEQERIEVQINAKSWLVHCYFEHIKRSKDTGKTNSLFGRAVKYNEEIWTLAKQLEDIQIRIEEQTNVLFWFGVCHFEQAIRAKDMNNAGKSFKQAAAFFKRQLRLAGQLEDKQSRIQQQIFAQFGLGRCYVGQVKRIKNKDKAEALFKKQAGKYLLAAYTQLSQLSDKAKKRIEKRIHQSLRDVDYLNGDWNSYFEKKKQETQESLFKGETSPLKDAVSTVLAVLHITPIELGFTPMAHYTSPHVCQKLFGIGGNETASPMRLGSSTYMNDPSEGRALLDLLNQQDLELENKADGASHNAFFTCFSSRVNDLNQFRLYGKEGGVEASGCCLVFNKNGDWLREADVSVPFRSLSKKLEKDSDDLPEAGFWNDEYEKLPLYQVAYIAYKDEYIAEKKCGIWLLPQEKLKFGIRLKPVGNEDWHQFRLGKLKEALEELIGFFNTSTVSDDDKEALEYIRYLFKDFAFRDEEEFRLLVIKPIDPNEIEYCETTQSVYVPYADIRNLADEVILGTNYEKTGNQRKTEVFRYQMKEKCPDVKVSRSTLPINPPNK